MTRPTTRPDRRPGVILVLFAVILITLLVLTALVLDGGMMMAARRRAQNAADGGALAAAINLMRGGTKATATAAACQYVQTYNGLAAAPVVNIPPASGPFAGNSRYVEVIVSVTYQTIFLPVAPIDPAPLGGDGRTQTVGARAVAGFQSPQWGEGPIVLDPFARPGIGVTGGGTLLINGTAVVNSQAAGVDENGARVDYGLQQYALSSGNNATIKARYIEVAGGVDVPANYQKYDPADESPLYCRAPIGPDPLRTLPVPDATNSGITNWTRNASVTVSKNETHTFSPGVYENIQINQGANVTFNPGVYIFSPTKSNQGLTLNGGCKVSGVGVMFYMTGSNYLDAVKGPGYWDAQDDALNNQLDGPLPDTSPGVAPPLAQVPLPGPPDPNFSQVKFATFTCNATNADVTLSGMTDGTFKGMLFYQRRRNTNTASIAGNAGVDVTLNGTIYAKWAQFSLAGGGIYNSVFVVGSLDISGGATVVINNPGGINLDRAHRVYLVE